MPQVRKIRLGCHAERRRSTLIGVIFGVPPYDLGHTYIRGTMNDNARLSVIIALRHAVRFIAKLVA